MEREMEYLGIQQQQQSLVKPSSGSSIQSNESIKPLPTERLSIFDTSSSDEFFQKSFSKQHKNSISNTLDRHRISNAFELADSFNNKILNRKYSLGHNFNSNFNTSRHSLSRNLNSNSTSSIPSQIDKSTNDLEFSQIFAETLVKRLPKIDEIYASKRRKTSFTHVDPSELDIPNKINFSIDGRFKKKLSLPQINTNSSSDTNRGSNKRHTSFYLS